MEHPETLALAQQLMHRQSVTPTDAGCMEIIGARLARLGFRVRFVSPGQAVNMFAEIGSGNDGEFDDAAPWIYPDNTTPHVTNVHSGTGSKMRWINSAPLTSSFARHLRIHSLSCRHLSTTRCLVCYLLLIKKQEHG
jgi:hypothetical protein